MLTVKSRAHAVTGNNTFHLGGTPIHAMPIWPGVEPNHRVCLACMCLCMTNALSPSLSAPFRPPTHDKYAPHAAPRESERKVFVTVRKTVSDADAADSLSLSLLRWRRRSSLSRWSRPPAELETTDLI